MTEQRPQPLFGTFPWHKCLQPRISPAVSSCRSPCAPARMCTSVASVQGLKSWKFQPRQPRDRFVQRSPSSAGDSTPWRYAKLVACASSPLRSRCGRTPPAGEIVYLLMRFNPAKASALVAAGCYSTLPKNASVLGAVH